MSATQHKLLIANRGEIVIRIAKAAKELGIPSVSIYSEDDATSLHLQQTDFAIAIEGRGPRAYLDIDAIIAVAKKEDCTMIHPGYGFLSESDAFAAMCAEEGIIFVGPKPEILDLFGNKIEARRLAENWGVPTIEGTLDTTTLEEAIAFFESLGEGAAMMIKAVAGGGGRGMRLVTKVEDISSSFQRCQSEAERAFGNGDVYVEKYIPKARHVEVQILGDGENISHLGERDCSIQRRNQKIIEIAPCPGIVPELREKLVNAAMLLAKAVNYNSVGTVEFLVEGREELTADTPFYFIEANPRLQVEHTITEEVMGIDLLLFQLQEAMGISLETMGLLEHEVPEPEGYAMQLRINTEVMDSEGRLQPKSGIISRYDFPMGEGIRVDGYGYEGYQTNPNFDSLLAKLICHSPYDHFGSVVEKAIEVLQDTNIEGVETNISLLKKVLKHPRFQAMDLSTRFVDTHILGKHPNIIIKATESEAPTDEAVLSFDSFPDLQSNETQTEKTTPAIVELYKEEKETEEPEEVEETKPTPVASNSFDNFPPLNAADFGESANDKTALESGLTVAPIFDQPQAAPEQPAAPTKKKVAANKETLTIHTPMPGSVLSILIKKGDSIRKGQELVVIEAMKMESVINATHSGVVEALAIQEGDILSENQPILTLRPTAKAAQEEVVVDAIDPDYIRPDLEAVHQRKSFLYDEQRPEAVAKRRKRGQYTARENIAALCDEGTFSEYGGMAIAAQTTRRSMEDLIQNTPADGLINGTGLVNGTLFGPDKAKCMIMAYDATVLAGTQGTANHMKMDRMLHLAEKWNLPIILFAEGGGGRPGDVDVQTVAGLQILTFTMFGRLSGKVPLISIVSRYCFAGNAALAGCSDVIIATENVSIGMGGPAMIEGGGLGTYHPKEVGPADVQTVNGVIDILVKDEMEAVAATKKYLSYFQGKVEKWECKDQRSLRHLIPENRKRTYDIRTVIEHLADTDSVLELRAKYGIGIITAFIRIEGHPIGLIANNPNHLGGAIDAEAAIKTNDFLKLCNNYQIPILSLCDTPGIMVGPEHEKEGTVRHASRMFIAGAQLKVPLMAIILRKGYGLGAMAMVGGSFHVPLFTVGWPTSEFGAMGLEGAVHLGYKKELEAIEDPDERNALFEKMVAELYERGKGISMATSLEIDDVIDPMETRTWILNGLKSTAVG